MTKPQILIHNIETNEIIEREMTDDEVNQYELDKQNAENLQTHIAAKEAARQALLDKLGITAEEAKLLLS